MTHCPVRPCRLRTRLASKTGWPQFSSCGGEAAARTSQRVSAVLASGSALKRRRKAVTVFCAQASVSRRLAIRSRIFGLPGISMTTAPKAAQESASFAARRASAASPTQSSNRRRINSKFKKPGCRKLTEFEGGKILADPEQAFARGHAGGEACRETGCRRFMANGCKPHAARRAQARPSGKDRRRRGPAECGGMLPPTPAWRGRPEGPLSFPRAWVCHLMRRGRKPAGKHPKADRKNIAPAHANRSSVPAFLDSNAAHKDRHQESFAAQRPGQLRLKICSLKPKRRPERAAPCV